jgi:hypothetical protein
MVAGHPYAPGDLVDYLLGELEEQEADALEEHLFECPVCAVDLEVIDRVAAAVRDAVHHGAVAANVSGAFLERATASGLSLREYRLAPGQTVACSAGPEDYIVIRLTGAFAGFDELSLRADFEDLDSGESYALPTQEVRADRELGEVLLVFPGAAVRAYPRSVWSLSLEGRWEGRETTFGPFVLDHTP